MIFLADKHDFHVTTEFALNEKNVGEIIHFIFFSALAWHPNNAKHFRWRFQLSCPVRGAGAMKSDLSKESYVSYGPWKIPHERRMRLTKMSHEHGPIHGRFKPQKYVTFSKADLDNLG